MSRVTKPLGNILRACESSNAPLSIELRAKIRWLIALGH
jgi:hypothetical protein